MFTVQFFITFVQFGAEVGGYFVILQQNLIYDS